MNQKPSKLCVATQLKELDWKQAAVVKQLSSDSLGTDDRSNVRQENSDFLFPHAQENHVSSC